MKLSISRFPVMSMSSSTLVVIATLLLVNIIAVISAQNTVDGDEKSGWSSTGRGDMSNYDDEYNQMLRGMAYQRLLSQMRQQLRRDKLEQKREKPIKYHQCYFNPISCF
ncbi:uncharacterized protein LOC141857317 [Brevipalpus obovatus]|uniref:uncharacterized protein LOC141857317 n=1 Tax=Brevipalpus obovatus TaxID=246614 RepID=UPI003D9F1097